MSEERRLSPLFTWRSAIADSDLRSSCKLVALTLSLHMSERGDSCFPAVATLAEESSLGVSTVREALAELHDEGWIIRDVQRGRRRSGGYASNFYTATVPEDRQQSAVSKPPADGVKSPGSGGEGVRTTEDSSSTASARARLPKTSGGQRVTEAEHDMVDAIIAVFNEAAGGKRFAGKEWREMIVRRLREHHDVSLEQHAEIIRQQFARPWWKGDATPSVIYGNGRVFDRALNGAQGGEQEERKKRYATE